MRTSQPASGWRADSCRRLAESDADNACFGHGDAMIGNASTALRETAERLEE